MIGQKIILYFLFILYTLEKKKIILSITIIILKRIGGKKKSREMEGEGKSNKGNKEFEAFQSLEIERLLWEVVNRGNECVDGDGCSIFLKEEGTTRYILRDSTVMSPYLGNYYFEVTPGEEIKEKMGATEYVVVAGKAKCVRDLREFKYWSNYGLTEDELKSMPIGHCELPHHLVGSFLGVPLLKEDEVVGVIRVVRHRENKKPFKDEDETHLIKLIDEYLPKIFGASNVSHLLEIGAMLDLKALCGQIVQVLTGMLRCRGCSIYLLTEEEDGIKRYRCMGTTGLHEILPEGSYREIKDPYNEAYYEYIEKETPKHLTTAVIKYGRNIITDDLAEFNPKDVFPEIERVRAKYWETCWKDGRLIPAGPSIFVPLFSPRRKKEEKSNVMGVIVINRPQGEEKFSHPESRLCLFLSERLSKIILYSRFMSLLNQPLFTIEDPVRLKESFDRLIDQICVVSGAPGATLFFKSENKLYSKSSSGRLRDKEIVYELPPSSSDYGSPPFTGYTVWVATFKKVLKFNSPDELDQWRSAFPPVHSGRGVCEVDTTPPPRFMALPIIGTNDELIGVLRTARTKADAPFTANDEMLFSSLANRLSPVIENLITLERLKEKRISELEEIFTKELKDKIEEVTEKNETTNFIAKRVRDFFTIDPMSEEDPGTRVLKSIRSSWEDLKIISEIEEAPLEVFKFFDEQMLTELPGYRGHFIHQYQVFLLGYYIIEMLKKLGNPFHNHYYQSLIPHISATEEEKEEVANIAWLVTSTFHDIAYPLEEIKRWLPKMISKFLGEAGEGIIPEVPIERIFFQDDQTYLNFVNELARFFNRKNFIPVIKESDFRDWLQMEVANNKDHGVLSSLILLTLRLLRKEEVILPAALAMALHKKLGLKVKAQGGKISYDKYPLFFLLLYCDIVQEWYRDPKYIRKPPTLKKIVVTKDVNEIGDVKSEIPQGVIENNETIYIHSEIVLAGREAGQKIKEVKDWFGFIHSSNPYFSIKINAEFFGSWEPDGHEAPFPGIGIPEEPEERSVDPTQLYDYHKAFEREKKIFREKERRLKKDYEGKYVAMLQGEVVDVDEDVRRLTERIQKSYGKNPVYIGPVGRVKTFKIPSPRLKG